LDLPVHPRHALFYERLISDDQLLRSAKVSQRSAGRRIGRLDVRHGSDDTPRRSCSGNRHDEELAAADFEAKAFNLFDKGPDEMVIGFSDGGRKVRARESAPDNRSGNESGDGIVPDLAGVSETMLWALYNRASEARRHDGVLVDPESVRIHEAIDYDFARHFGSPQGSLAVRAAEIDRALRRWFECNPDGCVVSLGEGLETQVRRVDNGRVRWLSVDLPDAIRLREHFLSPTDRFRHIGVSVLDPAWMEAVDPSAGVFIVAQGLLMYLEPEMVRQLFYGIATWFPEAEIVFDTVPRWFSRLTLLGLNQTSHYRLPPMPWGINRDELEPVLRQWCPYIASVTFLDYCAPRGLPLLLARLIHHVPFVRHEVPSLVHVTTTKTDRPQP
jgi:O-methyltransferase involved in polyketide biosynthesis